MKITIVHAEKGWYFIHPTKKMKTKPLWVGPFSDEATARWNISTEFHAADITVLDYTKETVPDELSDV